MSMDAARVSVSTASTTSGGASQRVTVSPGLGSTGHAPRSPEAGTGGASQREAGQGVKSGAVLASGVEERKRPPITSPRTMAPASAATYHLSTDVPSGPQSSRP